MTSSRSLLIRVLAGATVAATAGEAVGPVAGEPPPAASTAGMAVVDHWPPYDDDMY